MRVEITPRQFSIRIYDEHSDTDYIASAQLFSYGDRCSIYAICGPEFYSVLPQFMEAVENEGIVFIDGYVSKAHFRLIRMMMKKFKLPWSVKEDGTGIMYGHPLIWIRIEKEKA